MRHSFILFTLALVGLSFTLFAEDVGWHDVDESNRIGGRMISAGYLRGKVVMVDCRDYGAKPSLEAIKRLQSIWTAYKSKPFILVGSHSGAAKKSRVAAIMDKLSVTYPVYRDFGADAIDKIREDDDEAPESMIYVFDETGKRVYRGGDDRAAMGAVGNALMNMAAPRNVKEWRHFLDWEVKNLPGRALLRLKDFETQHPDEAKEFYAEEMKSLGDRPEVKKLSKLVAAAKLVKDRDPNSPAAQKLTKDKIDTLIEKYESLKSCSDQNVVQEAKNALAELKWASATLPKQ